MVKRRKVGIIYQYNENWIGGTYYIDNLVSALNFLDDERKPRIVILSPDQKSFQRIVDITGYPYLEHGVLNKTLSLLQRAANKMARLILSRNLFSPFHINPDIEIIFPSSYEHIFLPGPVKLFWIPDFQEFYLPHFFTKREISIRKQSQKEVIKFGEYIVFSSYSARKDFDSIYPNNSLKQFVLQFAVSHPPLNESDIGAILRKYNLPNKYFICSNQFWRHKNHNLVLQALKLVRKESDIFVVFTGKENDYRNPEYFSELKQLIRDNGIGEKVSFLGFISRDEQLALLKNAIAIIQPSLFEGWSTIVEDAKALGKPLIVSDIDVHREQLIDYPQKIFIDPYKPEQLKMAITDIKFNSTNTYDYTKKIKEYSGVFMDIVNKII